ncbi:MAG: hypothetical protein JWQ71_2129 [Pedosphaera sp.]|nr:hypothetical protein [Pedosphaera sp.]
MKAETSFPKRVTFHQKNPENFILVENNKNRAMIRAAFDNFSEARKVYFIKELAAEGFIPDHYQWFSDPDSDGYFGVRWIVDDSWLEVDRIGTLKTEMLCRRMLLLACILWVVLMSLLLWNSR